MRFIAASGMRGSIQTYDSKREAPFGHIGGIGLRSVRSGVVAHAIASLVQFLMLVTYIGCLHIKVRRDVR